MIVILNIGQVLIKTGQLTIREVKMFCKEVTIKVKAGACMLTQAN